MTNRICSFSAAFGALAAVTLITGDLSTAHSQIPSSFISLPSTAIPGSYYSTGVLLYEPTTNLLLGTSQGGGLYGSGSLFSVNPFVGASSFNDNFYSFTGGADGGGPSAGVITDVSHNLFGTTTYGGANGSGDVFELKYTATSPTSGYYASAPTDIYNFAANEVVGSELTLSGGHLYGVANTGGSAGPGGPGTVFEIIDPYASTPSPSNGVTLYDFANSTGSSPTGGVAVTSNPNGPGVTLFGGLGIGLGGASGSGGIYSLTVTNPGDPASGSISINDVYDFTGQSNGDGSGPVGAPLMINGSLYGVTNSGGSGGSGAIYEIANPYALTPADTILNSFNEGVNGSAPYGTAIQDGRFLLGTTSQGAFGGIPGNGTVWSYDLVTNQINTLLSFDGANSGAIAYVGLAEIQPGIFAGVNTSGGANGNGVLFILTPEPGSIATMFIGAVTLGGVLVRRRKSK